MGDYRINIFPGREVFYMFPTIKKSQVKKKKEEKNLEIPLLFITNILLQHKRILQNASNFVCTCKHHNNFGLHKEKNTAFLIYYVIFFYRKLLFPSYDLRLGYISPPCVFTAFLFVWPFLVA